MSNDVINALKRLERVGAENSRATEKLIQAAHTAGVAIAERMARGGLSCFEWPDERGEDYYPWQIYYSLSNGETSLICKSISMMRFGNSRGWDRATREEALRLSRWIAGGLLSALADAMQEDLVESEIGAVVLEGGVNE